MKGRVILDTGVIVEYIDLGGPYHRPAETLFAAIIEGKLEALIPHPVLAETFYVSYKIYRKLGAPSPQRRAKLLVEWLYRLTPREPLGNGLDLALEAGKAKLRYKLALTDCYVLALSKVVGARPIFRRREREMERHLDEIERKYNPLFLEDYTDTHPLDH